MTQRAELDAKLESVNGWVRGEFGYVDDLMAGVGADGQDISGPGRSYRLDGRVVLTAHPKTSRLMLSSPLWDPSELGALQVALSQRRSGAWLTYEPGTVDRATVEALVETALHRQPDTDGAPGGSRAAALDAAPDPALTLLLGLLRAFARHERDTGAPSSVKVLREAIFLHWEAPRLPAGGRYSPLLPHSPQARAVVTDQAARRPSGLVFEHVHPISLLIRSLLADLPADEAALGERLRTNGDHVVLTQDEDRQLTAAGYRNAIPESGGWGRYAALGLRREDFRPVVGSAQ
ncbi:MAG: hypothetical protein ACTHMS_16195 [Jatrophihabitans sp.]|uniref:hypothetical protein n=1 Tax=Jatrophihabitans sp. TaxID=1932789 RepID=UPI003F7D8395